MPKKSPPFALRPMPYLNLVSQWAIGIGVSLGLVLAFSTVRQALILGEDIALHLHEISESQASLVKLTIIELEYFGMIPYRPVPPFDGGPHPQPPPTERKDL